MCVCVSVCVLDVVGLCWCVWVCGFVCVCGCWWGCGELKQEGHTAGKSKEELESMLSCQTTVYCGSE